MQLSCLPVSLFDDIIEGRMSVAQWAGIGADIGLEAIDLSILFVHDKSLGAVAALRRDIEAAGVRVAMVTTYPDFTQPEPARRALELSLEEEAIAVAAELGAELVRVTDGQAHPETTREEGIAWAVESLTRLVETSRAFDLTLVYENHSRPGVWEYTDFSEPPDIFLEIVRATADVGLGVNFDTGNATAFSPDPVALLDQVIDRVVSVHASDTSVHGALQPVPLGRGVTPFTALFKRLKQAGWDGWICMEEASFQGRAGIEDAAQFIRQVWNAC